MVVTLATFSYGEGSRLFSVAFSNFPVIEAFQRKIHIGNYRELKAIGLVRKRDESGAISITDASLSIDANIYKNSRQFYFGNKEDFWLIGEMEKSTEFLISGSSYAPIVSSISVYKTGYYFDSSNAVSFFAMPYMIISPKRITENRLTFQNVFFSNKATAKGVNYTVYTERIENRVILGVSIPKSNFLRINSKRGEDTFVVFSRTSRVFKSQEVFIKMKYILPVSNSEQSVLTLGKIELQDGISGTQSFFRLNRRERSLDEKERINDIILPLIDCIIYA